MCSSSSFVVVDATTKSFFSFAETDDDDDKNSPPKLLLFSLKLAVVKIWFPILKCGLSGKMKGGERKKKRFTKIYKIRTSGIKERASRKTKKIFRTNQIRKKNRSI